MKVKRPFWVRMKGFAGRLSSITLAEWHHCDGQWWIGILGVEWNCEDVGYLFYVERNNGAWKFDVLWVRPFYYRWLFK